MPTSKKIFTVQNLTEKVKQAKGLVLADYQGLSVEQISELRQEVKKAGGEFEVVKNSLLRLALENYQPASPAGGLPITNYQLQGPTAALWVYKEDTAPLKALDQFRKKTALPKIKLGFWEGEIISIEKIKELATLPGLNELRAKLVDVLQSPVSGLTNALGENLRKLVLILKSGAGKGLKPKTKNKKLKTQT